MQVKIDLEPDQTLEEAEELLYKALTAKRGGGPSGPFPDRIVEMISEHMKKEHREMFKKLLTEIYLILEE